MLVFRLEHNESNIGPYRIDANDCNVIHHLPADFWDASPKHPSIGRWSSCPDYIKNENDEEKHIALKRLFEFEYYLDVAFGFESIHDLKKWFCIDIRTILKQDFSITVYEVDNRDPYFCLFEKQCTFSMSKAILKTKVGLDKIMI